MNTIPKIMIATKMTKNNYTYYKDRYRCNSRDYSLIIIDQILDKDNTIDLQVHIHLDRDMTIIIREGLHLDLHIDRHIETIPILDTILVQDIDLVLNHKEILLNDTIIHIVLQQDQKIIDQD